MSTNPVALEFVRFVLQEHPCADDFTALYDAMSRAAAGRRFRNLGRDELAQVGVSFSLMHTARLEALINEAQAGKRKLRTLTPVSR